MVSYLEYENKNVGGDYGFLCLECLLYLKTMKSAVVRRFDLQLVVRRVSVPYECPPQH